MLEIADIVAQAGAPESEFTRFASVTSDLIRFVDLFRAGDTEPRFRLRDYQFEFGPGGSTAPDVVLRRDSSTGLLHSLSSFQVGFANNSTGSQRNAGMRFDAAAQHGIEPHHDGSLWGTALFTRTGGEIRFGRYGANATAQNTLELLGRFGGSGGFVVGSPTGGDKGAGGINATGVWVNNQPVWHAGNLDPATGLLASAGGVHRAWSAGSDIDSLIPGSTFGSVLESVVAAHFVVGLRSNDSEDSFVVISKSSAANATSDPYNRVCLRVAANGAVFVPGSIDLTGAATFRAGINLTAQPTGESATHFAVWATDPSTGVPTMGSRSAALVRSDIGAAAAADLSSYVTLGTAQTIAGAKTFSAADNILAGRLTAVQTDNGATVVQEGTTTGGSLRVHYTNVGGTGHNYPEGGYGVGLVVNRVSASAIQRGSFRFWGTASDNEEIYFSKSSGSPSTAWSPWRQIWHSGNLVPSTLLNTSATAQTKAGGLTLNGDIRVDNNDPRIIFNEQDAAANGRRADFIHQSGNFVGRLYNDALNSSTDWLQVIRSSHTASEIRFRATSPTGFKVTTDGLTFHSIYHEGNPPPASGGGIADVADANHYVRTLGSWVNADNRYLRLTGGTLTGNLSVSTNAAASGFSVSNAGAGSSGTIASFVGNRAGSPVYLTLRNSQSADTWALAADSGGDFGIFRAADTWALRFTGGAAKNAILSGNLTISGAETRLRAAPAGEIMGWFLGTLVNPASGHQVVLYRTATEVRSDIGAAAVSHAHGAGDITSGVLNPQRLAGQAVTGSVLCTSSIDASAWVSATDDSQVLLANFESTPTFGKVGNAHLRTSGACSVIGRSANSTGQVADISASTDGHVLRRSGGVLGFGQLTTANLPAGTACSVLGRADNSGGALANIPAAANGYFLARKSDSVGFSAITTADLPPTVVLEAPTDGKYYSRRNSAWVESPSSGGPSVLGWKHVTVNAATGAITGTQSSGGSAIVIEAHSDAHEFIARVPASLGSYSIRITVRPPVGVIDDAAHSPAFERIADESVGGVNHHTYHVWSRGNPYDVLQAAPVDRLCIEVIQ